MTSVVGRFVCASLVALVLALMLLGVIALQFPNMQPYAVNFASDLIAAAAVGGGGLFIAKATFPASAIGQLLRSHKALAKVAQDGPAGDKKEQIQEAIKKHRAILGKLQVI